MQHGGGGWSANVFFALCMDWLIDFLRNEKKQCANYAWNAKSVTEKNNRRVDCAEADKKTVQALRFGMLSELTRKGEDFCLPGIARLSCP